MRNGLLFVGILVAAVSCAHGGAGSAEEPSVDDIVGRAAKESRPVAMVFHADW